jgi:UDP-N-acetyl-D-mannosaminuronic acid dehydrogenase
MPSFTVSKVREGLESQGIAIEDSKVVVLGLTYRPGVEEIRASPSIPITHELTDLGADVYAVDPLLDTFDGFEAQPVDQEDLYDLRADALVLVTPHEEFETIRWEELDTDPNGPSVLIDGRATLDGLDFDAWTYTIGSGTR